MKARAVALLLAAVLVFYLITIGWRGLLLIGEGSAISVALGVGLLVLPALGGWALIHELRFGVRTARLARRLDAEGGLPIDDLPRRPSGRVDRGAADAAFASARAQLEAQPADWRRWFRLATAYDAAGDRRRAREAMRQAIALAEEPSTPVGQQDARSDRR